VEQRLCKRRFTSTYYTVELVLADRRVDFRLAVLGLTDFARGTCEQAANMDKYGEDVAGVTIGVAMLAIGILIGWLVWA
jgi:hypothetical protein